MDWFAVFIINHMFQSNNLVIYLVIYEKMKNYY